MTVDDLTRKARRWSVLIGGLVWIAAVVVAIGIWRHYRASIPRLNGIPVPPADGSHPTEGDVKSAAYVDALGIPWSVPITSAEQQTLRDALPVGKPLFYGDLRLWLESTSDRRLGVIEPDAASRLDTAFTSLSAIDGLRLEPSDTPVARAARDADVQEAVRELAAIASAPEQGHLWVVSYNRGILYLLEGNRQRAQTELRRAYARIPKINPAWPPRAGDSELYNAVIHTAYALGHISLATSQETSLDAATRDTAAAQAVSLFRHAVLLSVWHRRMIDPADSTYPAAYYSLPVTELSTRALRNDLAATYLSAPRYRYCDSPMPNDVCSCSAPMPRDVCSRPDLTGNCDYRDNLFCTTERGIVSNRLSVTYNALLAEYRDGGTVAAEPALWALQTLVEAESSNSGLVADPLAAYNLGLLLIGRDQVVLASSYLREMLRNGDADVQMPPQITRLGYFSAMLAGDNPLRRPARAGSPPVAESRARRAYGQIYKNIDAPPAFPSLAGDAPLETASSIDRWLFIVRYRDLLGKGLLDTFMTEHDSAMGALNDDFLQRWRNDALESFVAGAAERYARAKQRGDTRQTTLIRSFLLDSGYFDRDVVARHGVRPDFVSARGLAVLIILGVVALAALSTFLLSLCNRALRNTFFSWHRHWRNRTEASPA